MADPGVGRRVVQLSCTVDSNGPKHDDANGAVRPVPPPLVGGDGRARAAVQRPAIHQPRLARRHVLRGGPPSRIIQRNRRRVCIHQQSPPLVDLLAQPSNVMQVCPMKEVAEVGRRGRVVVEDMRPFAGGDVQHALQLAWQVVDVGGLDLGIVVLLVQQRKGVRLPTRVLASAPVGDVLHEAVCGARDDGGQVGIKILNGHLSPLARHQFGVGTGGGRKP
eukprot:scaffold1377_cov92-Isochrysis_galbana.AAC.3